MLYREDPETLTLIAQWIGIGVTPKAAPIAALVAAMGVLDSPTYPHLPTVAACEHLAIQQQDAVRLPSGLTFSEKRTKRVLTPGVGSRTLTTNLPAAVRRGRRAGK